MIRKSAVIATVAILLSLLLHVFGLSLTPRVQQEQSAEAAWADTVEMGNSFEDIAEDLTAPVPPEPAEPPEPPVAKVPEPEPAETPTSEALVASANPKRVFAPDSGITRVAKPETTGPSEPEEADSPEPEAVKPASTDEKTITEPVEASPVVTETVTAPPETPQPPAPESAEPVGSPPNAPEAQQLAALPPPPTSVLPVTPSPEVATIPVIPLARESVEPVPEEPETAQTEDQAAESGLAVIASVRPRDRAQRPSADATQSGEPAAKFSELQFPALIESPLATYRRDRGDLKVQQNAGAQSGGLGFQDSRGPGNSDETNYAGRVLMHLNRAPAVRVSGRGAARVFFVINPDGSLATIGIIDSTGSNKIDRAAKEQIRVAAPFPLPPQGRRRTLTFVYRIN